METKHKIINTKKQIDKLIKYCKKTKYCCFDFETTGLEFHKDFIYPTILGISFQPGSCYIIPLGHFDSPFKNEYPEIIKYIGKNLLENTKVIKIGWNIKFDAKWFMRYGIKIKGICLDAMLAKYALDEEIPHGLKSAVAKWFPGNAKYEEEIKKQNWADININELSEYCAIDCDATFRLMMYFERLLIKDRLYSMYRNILMMGSKVLTESEFEGIKVNKPYLEKLIEEYNHMINDTTEKIKNTPKIKMFEDKRRKQYVRELIEGINEEIAQLNDTSSNYEKLKSNRLKKIENYTLGIFSKKENYGGINFNSPKQLIELLFTNEHGFKFDVVKYTINNKTKQKTDTPSTDEEVLLELERKDKTDFIKNMLRLRELSKLYSTYMVGIHEKLSDQDKIHGSFLLHGTVTGRLSSKEPNLQNIPRDTTAPVIKKMFISPKNYKILQIDYSQVELRIMAECANEESMLEWFKTGKDIHLASACKKWRENYNDILKIYENEDDPNYIVWKKRRKQAKTINFGIIYGQTAKKLASTLSEPGDEVSIPKAQRFLDDFGRDFPKIMKFMRTQKRIVNSNKYVTTLFGRRRRLPLIDSSDKWLRFEAERQAVNSPIQGSASDFALFSSIIIRESILKNTLPKDLKQIYTVHDSLGYYCPADKIHEVIPIMNKICENPHTLKYFDFEMRKVKMEVDFEIGDTWGDLKRYDKDTDYTKT